MRVERSGFQGLTICRQARRAANGESIRVRQFAACRCDETTKRYAKKKPRAPSGLLKHLVRGQARKRRERKSRECAHCEIAKNVWLCVLFRVMKQSRCVS